MTLTRGLPVLAGGLWLVGGPGLTADTDALVYLLDCGDGQAVLIDCGSDAARLLDNVAAAGFAPSAVVGILATHGHVDHVSAAADLIEAGCGGLGSTRPRRRRFAMATPSPPAPISMAARRGRPRSPTS